MRSERGQPCTRTYTTLPLSRLRGKLGMSGTELVRRIRLDRPELATPIVSGHAKVEMLAPDLRRLTSRSAELSFRLRLSARRTVSAS